tara:strand:+ start:123 stop:500 length:378 start_codon:yes stop_codon:yes gene_type:complete
MVEINNQGINNYLAQQTGPQVAKKSTAQTSQVQEKFATEDKGEGKKEQRGVILEISQEARQLSKADLNDEAKEAIMISRRSKSNLYSAIIEARKYQENVTEKVSEMIEAVKEGHLAENSEQTMAA